MNISTGVSQYGSWCEMVTQREVNPAHHRPCERDCPTDRAIRRGCGVSRHHDEDSHSQLRHEQQQPPRRQLRGEGQQNNHRDDRRGDETGRG